VSSSNIDASSLNNSSSSSSSSSFSSPSSSSSSSTSSTSSTTSSTTTISSSSLSSSSSMISKMNAINKINMVFIPNKPNISNNLKYQIIYKRSVPMNNKYPNKIIDFGNNFNTKIYYILKELFDYNIIGSNRTILKTSLSNNLTKYNLDKNNILINFNNKINFINKINRIIKEVGELNAKIKRLMILFYIILINHFYKDLLYEKNDSTSGLNTNFYNDIVWSKKLNIYLSNPSIIQFESIIKNESSNSNTTRESANYSSENKKLIINFFYMIIKNEIDPIIEDYHNYDPFINEISKEQNENYNYYTNNNYNNVINDKNNILNYLNTYFNTIQDIGNDFLNYIKILRNYAIKTSKENFEKTLIESIIHAGKDEEDMIDKSKPFLYIGTNSNYYKEEINRQMKTLLKIYYVIPFGVKNLSSTQQEKYDNKTFNFYQTHENLGEYMNEITKFIKDIGQKTTKELKNKNKELNTIIKNKFIKYGLIENPNKKEKIKNKFIKYGLIENPNKKEKIENNYSDLLSRKKNINIKVINFFMNLIENDIIINTNQIDYILNSQNNVNIFLRQIMKEKEIDLLQKIKEKNDTKKDYIDLDIQNHDRKEDIQQMLGGYYNNKKKYKKLINLPNNIMNGGDFGIISIPAGLAFLKYMKKICDTYGKIIQEIKTKINLAFGESNIFRKLNDYYIYKNSMEIFKIIMINRKNEFSTYINNFFSMDKTNKKDKTNTILKKENENYYYKILKYFTYEVIKKYILIDQESLEKNTETMIGSILKTKNITKYKKSNKNLLLSNNKINDNIKIIIDNIKYTLINKTYNSFAEINDIKKDLKKVTEKIDKSSYDNYPKKDDFLKTLCEEIIKKTNKITNIYDELKNKFDIFYNNKIYQNNKSIDNRRYFLYLDSYNNNSPESFDSINKYDKNIELYNYYFIYGYYKYNNLYYYRFYDHKEINNNYYYYFNIGKFNNCNIGSEKEFINLSVVIEDNIYYNNKIPNLQKNNKIFHIGDDFQTYYNKFDSFFKTNTRKIKMIKNKLNHQEINHQEINNDEPNQIKSEDNIYGEISDNLQTNNDREKLIVDIFNIDDLEDIDKLYLVLVKYYIAQYFQQI